MFQSKKSVENMTLTIIATLIIMGIALFLVVLFLRDGINKGEDNLNKHSESLTACELGSYAIPDDTYSSANLKPECDQGERIIRIANSGNQKCCAVQK